MTFILFDIWGVEKNNIYIYKLFYIINSFYLIIKNTTFDFKSWFLGGGGLAWRYMYIYEN